MNGAYSVGRHVFIVLSQFCVPCNRHQAAILFLDIFQGCLYREQPLKIFCIPLSKGETCLLPSIIKIIFSEYKIHLLMLRFFSYNTTHCLCEVIHPSCSSLSLWNWEAKGSDTNLLILIPPEVLDVTQSFLFDPGVPYVLQAFMKPLQINMLPCYRVKFKPSLYLTGHIPMGYAGMV